MSWPAASKPPVRRNCFEVLFYRVAPVSSCRNLSERLAEFYLPSDAYLKAVSTVRFLK